jgi:hypothetical protein
MAGNFPFAIDALKGLRIQKKDGKGIDIFPWKVLSLSPLISLTIDENIFNPLMSGTLMVKDVGDWSNEMQLNSFDEIVIKLNSKKAPDELDGDASSSTINSKTFVFEIINVKNSVDSANQAYQNSIETTRAITIEFVSKSIITKEFLSSMLEDENFIGPIINSEGEKFELEGSEPTGVELKGFDTYLRQKLGINLDADRTWNHCYLKKNNVSYPWGKLKGQPTILQTLQYLAENAVEYENNTAVNYLFWQDMHGYHFRSINSLIKQNIGQASAIVYDFNDIELFPTSIKSFNTLTEFDALNLISSDAYFSWYERILPDYADPYLDFVDSSDALIRKKVYYDLNKEYSYISHIETGKLFQAGITSDLAEGNSKFIESKRKDDEIYGFFSKNRYNTPHPQEWDYLGISADTRLSNVVWQNQYDLDDEVYPEILYTYDKIVKKTLAKNRAKYVELKNAKRKWEVYRCSVCCSTQQGGTADLKIINNIGASGGTGNDYVYYFGATGIFGDLSSEGYGIVAAGAFSDVVNYIPGASGVSGNGLTLSYDMNSFPYNQTIGEFYHLSDNLTDINNQINKTIAEYQNDLSTITPYITRIENDFLPFVDAWIIDATDFAYTELTPGFKQTCSVNDGSPVDHGPGTGTKCCIDKGNGNPTCFSFGIIDEYPQSNVDLTYFRSQIGGPDFRFDFGNHTCGSVKKLPLYRNLQFDTNEFSSYPTDFSGYWDKLINYSRNGINYPFYITPAAKMIYDLFGCDNIVDGKMAYELDFEKPDFLYECSKTKLLTGSYFRTFESSNFISGEYNEFEINSESDWSIANNSDDVDNGTAWCATCLDPIAMRGAKFEYTKVLKQLKLRKLVLENLITKLQNIQNTFNQKYQEYLNRKAFFISKNPYDSEQLGNILNKKSSINLMNVKSIKRKPIRGSKYEVLAKRVGITSGVGTYMYDVFFNDDRTRTVGITGNHPYYDQKYKTFNTNTQASQNYASRSGFDIQKRDFDDAYYYDNDLAFMLGSPGMLPESIPDDIAASLVTPGNVYTNNNLSYQRVLH